MTDEMQEHVRKLHKSGEANVKITHMRYGWNLKIDFGLDGAFSVFLGTDGTYDFTDDAKRPLAAFDLFTSDMTAGQRNGRKLRAR